MGSYSPVGDFFLPLRDLGVLLSLLALYAAAKASAVVAGLFLTTVFPLGVMIAVFAAIVFLPLTARYAMEVLDARIADRPPVPLTVGLIGKLGLVWSLVPLLLLLGCAFAVIEAYRLGGGFAALVTGLVLAALLPASLSMLALTGRALAAVNPVHLLGLIGLCGMHYAVPVLVINLAAAVLVMLGRIGAPAWVIELTALMSVFGAVVVAGGVVAASGANDRVVPAGIGPRHSGPRRATHETGRTAALDHSYALMSRGNAGGGLNYIDEFIGNSASDADFSKEYAWFLARMLTWEDKGPALALGRRMLSRLVELGDAAAVAKILGQCLHVDPGFRPDRPDRVAIKTLLESAGRDDLVQKLR